MNEQTKQLGLGILIGIVIASTIGWLLLNTDDGLFFSGQYSKADLMAAAQNDPSIGQSLGNTSNLGPSHNILTTWKPGAGPSLHFLESTVHDQYTSTTYPGHSPGNGTIHDISTWVHYWESSLGTPSMMNVQAAK